MTTGDLLLNALFYLFAGIGLAGSLGVALSKNIVRSSFALLFVLFAAAALYAVMKADFMFAAQVLIYVGGILVLIIFAIMLTHKITDVNLSNESTPGPVAFFAVLCVLFTLGVLIFNYDWANNRNEAVRAEGPMPTDEELQAKYNRVAADLAKKTQDATQVSRDRIGDDTIVEVTAAPEPDGLVQTLGYGLMTRYLLAFEVISVLLLAALIGAAFLARKEVRS